MKKLLLTLTAAAALAACSQKSTPVADAPAAAEPPAEISQPPSTTAAPTADELKQAATSTQESADATEVPGDAALERLAAMPESTQLPGGRWKAGTNYVPVVPAQGTSAEAGKVEVLEFLWLGCPHCYELNPYVESWKGKLPTYVKFSQEHVMWGPAYRGHAKLFYTLQVMNRGDLISKAFDEIHRRGNRLVERDDAGTQTAHIAWAKSVGLNEADFKREYNGFGVNTRLQRAEELTRRYRIETVPTFIVNGKYRTEVSMAGGPAQLMQLLSDLAAAEKR